MRTSCSAQRLEELLHGQLIFFNAEFEHAVELYVGEFDVSQDVFAELVEVEKTLPVWIHV